MPQLKLYLFGPPRLEVHGQNIHLSLRKAYALLAYLAVTDQSHSRDTLATLFWPEANQRAARTNLRRMIYEVGQRIEEELLIATSETICLHPAVNLWLDVAHFKQYAAIGLGTIRKAVGSPARFSSEKTELENFPDQYLDTPPQVQALLAAVNLYQDDFMAGFSLNDCPEFDEWQFFQREELRQTLAQLLTCLTTVYVEQEAYEEALLHARRWLALDPLHEPAHRRLMKLYALAGQQSAAIRQYQECERILDEELGVAPEEETSDLLEAIRKRQFQQEDQTRRQKGDEVTAPAGSDISPFRHTLPPQSGRFIGRAADLRQIRHRLTEQIDCRLLTLVGVGGIGKTRLAIQAAQVLIDELDGLNCFRNGIYFVPLQSIERSADIASAIADVVGIRLQSETPLRKQLLDYLCTKEMLLLLDNFEHLLDGTELVTDILAHAPDVKILITSREALRIREEWFYPIAGLTFPNHQDLSTDRIDLYDSIQFFDQMAQRAQINFSLEREVEHVVRICRLVDGIPLAIELAAAWLRVLSCAQIADEIERNIDILTTEYRDIPERHRSMRAVLEQTWQLLSEPEQSVLMRLSVCRGGFRQDAAIAIAEATLPILVGLVEKSMLSKTPADRFHVHELLRQFAGERLKEAGTPEKDIGKRHSHYYVNYIAELELALISNEQVTALEAIGEEFDNVKAAWDWAVTHMDLGAIEQGLNSLHFYYWFRRGREGAELFAETMKRLEAHSPEGNLQSLGPIEINLSRKLGLFYYYVGNFSTARFHLEASLVAAQRFNSLRDQAYSLNALGTLAG